MNTLGAGQSGRSRWPGCWWVMIAESNFSSSTTHHPCTNPLACSSALQCSWYAATDWRAAYMESVIDRPHLAVLFSARCGNTSKHRHDCDVSDCCCSSSRQLCRMDGETGRIFTRVSQSLLKTGMKKIEHIFLQQNKACNMNLKHTIHCKGKCEELTRTSVRNSIDDIYFFIQKH